MPTFKPTFANAQQQRGAVLIAALMILTAMTVLGFSSLSNTGVQSAISRNTQFLMYARNVANTEINGQIGVINNNLPTDTDAIVQTLLDQGEAVELLIADSGATPPVIDDLQTPQSAYTQRVSMTMTCESCPAPMGGFSFGGSGVAALVATVDSTAQLANTAASSTQTQGYWYLIPSN